MHRASEYLRRLAMAESLPAHQPQHLLVCGRQPLDRLHQPELAVVRSVIYGSPQTRFAPETLKQTHAATPATPVVEDHMPRRSVQPQTSVNARRNRIQPPPSSGEHIRDNIGNLRR